MFACSGAGLRTRSPASGALVLTLALTLTSVTPVSAVCVHCKGFVDGCTGSLDLMPWGADSFQLLRDVFGDFFIFPLSAQEKPLEPGVVRPLDDHTRTGLNAATFRDFLRHVRPCVTWYVAELLTWVRMLHLCVTCRARVVELRMERFGRASVPG